MTIRNGVTIDGVLARLPPSCPPRGRGWCAALACLLEATAPKPGNVHPTASFPDLAYDDLVAAALAIAPAMERAAANPLGRTILDAITASRAVTRSNANLGIVLVIAPLAAVPDRDSGSAGIVPADVEAVLSRLTAADAAQVWQAIHEARPGGMGASSRWDLADPPPVDLRAAMRHAATNGPGDQIARLWAEGYGGLFAGPVQDLGAELGASHPPAGTARLSQHSSGVLPNRESTGVLVLDAIVRCQLRHLARVSDTLIARRHGVDVAADVSRRAAAVLAESEAGWRGAAAAFDRHLRTGRRLNPGTTADLLAAALYILLRDGRLPAPLDMELPLDVARIPSPTERA